MSRRAGLTAWHRACAGGQIPFTPLLADALFLAPQAFGQQVTHGTQGTRARQDHAQASQRQHASLGLAQMGQMMHGRRQPLVEAAQ